jgi:hypothetical protein
MSVVGTRCEAVGARRNDRFHSQAVAQPHQVIGVVALVGEQCARRGKAANQVLGLADVGRLTAGEHERQEIAQGIGEGVDLGAEAPARTSQRVLYRAAPAAQAWARTTVLSISRCCRSGSRAMKRCNARHTPLFCQRLNRLNTLFQAPRCGGNNRH